MPKKKKTRTTRRSAPRAKFVAYRYVIYLSILAIGLGSIRAAAIPAYGTQSVLGANTFAINIPGTTGSTGDTQQMQQEMMNYIQQMQNGSTGGEGGQGMPVFNEGVGGTSGSQNGFVMPSGFPRPSEFPRPSGFPHPSGFPRPSGMPPRFDNEEGSRGAGFNTRDLRDKMMEMFKARMATGAGGFKDKRFFGATAHIPISIDKATNTLTITKPDGTTVNVVLPATAIQNMLNNGILSKINGDNASGSGQFGGFGGGKNMFKSTSVEDGTSPTGAPTENVTGTTGDNQDLQLTQENGQYVYKIKGTVQKKFLGLVPVSLSRDVTVSATTGQVAQVSEPLFTRFLSALSF